MKVWNKMTKTKAVLLHLEDFGSITSWEAIKEYGAPRLSAIIYNLRHKYDMNIYTKRVYFIDRYGNNASYGKYILVKDDEKYE